MSGVLAGALGCGDGEEGDYIEPLPVAGDVEPPRGYAPYFADERTPPPDDLDWERCALVSGTEGDSAECARVEVPLRWSEPEGEVIELFVKRYRPSSTPRGQLWLLAGGPGGSGAEFDDQVFSDPRDDYVPSFGEMAPDLEVYLLDHRGTGRSTRLVCPVAESADSDDGTYIGDDEWQGCMGEIEDEWGEGLAGFSITNAATDLGYLIDRTRHGDEPVFVYGVSYGTLWAQRYLHVYPEQATGVALDSICSPGDCDFGLAFDRGFDEVGRAVVARCQDDPECRSEFADNDVEAALAEVFDAAERGGSADVGLDFEAEDLRVMLGLMLRSVALRDLVPATLARLQACDGNGVARVLAVLLSYEDTEADRLYSTVLNRHIGLSEVMSVPPASVEEAEEHVASLRFSLDAGPDFAALRESGWPVYERDEFVGELPETTVPMLLMNGTLDPQTPLSVAERAGEHFDGPNQTFVVVPYAGHSVINQSPIELDDDGTLRTCGQILFEQFVADPTAPLDTSCTEEVLEPDFRNEGVSAAVFGTIDPFSIAPTRRAPARSRSAADAPLRVVAPQGAVRLGAR